MEQDPIPQDNRPEWLRALTEKSWNLELIISGAAIYLTTRLPEIVDSMLRYYLENWVLDEDYRKIALPLLVYSFMKVIGWMLIATFVTHFVMRAFWVGLVGLHTAYAEGIRYENLPWQNDFTKEQSRLRFGALADYIQRLDRLCNQVFALAFFIAMLSLGICIAYVFFFLLMNVVPLWLGKAAARIVILVVVYAFMLLAMLPVILQLIMRMPRFAENALAKRLAAWSVQRVGGVLMPLVYKPMTYLNLTFISNIPKKRLLVNMIIGTTLVLTGVLVNFSATFFHLIGLNAYTTREYYATGRNIHSLRGGPYDNMRSPEARLPPVSIPSEVVEGPFLRVFVDYPKLLDAALAQRCAPADTFKSLPLRARHTPTDSAYLACMSDFFRLSVNDSIVAQPGWMFHEHPVVGTPGLVVYLPTATFLPGKNWLKVEVPSSPKPDSLRVYGQLPFWFGG